MLTTWQTTFSDGNSARFRSIRSEIDLFSQNIPCPEHSRGLKPFYFSKIVLRKIVFNSLQETDVTSIYLS